MSIDEEKKFVIKHTFTDVKKLKQREHHFGPQETHFGVPWYFSFYQKNVRNKFVEDSHYWTIFDLNLEQGYYSDKKWSMDTTIKTKLIDKSGRKRLLKMKRVFDHTDIDRRAWLIVPQVLNNFLIDGNVTVECEVTIHEMPGIEEKIFKNFNDDLAKELSDVVLKVEDQKFYVNKMYLAGHSTYFKALFLGNFDESKQSEVELKDIDPIEFQKFLEVVYGEPAIDEDNIEGILQLADMYDAKTVIRQCEQFLLHRSEESLKLKFNIALKYNMDQLKKKCISELKSVEDIEKVIAENHGHIDEPTSMKLQKMVIEFQKNNSKQ